jgi:probable F420-dependent oxidoreductase
MKVRFGIGTGAPGDASTLLEVADAIVGLGFDSIWLPEVLSTSAVDPMVGLAWVGASFPKLKLGTTMLLPGRNPVRLAKELATLDALSGGRLLVTMVSGLSIGAERVAIGVPPKERGAAFDRVMPMLRRWWAGEEVEGVTVSPRPVQQPLEMWLGGMVPAALERCGRLGDGWLPSLISPADGAAGKVVIDEAAERAGRSIDPEHFGISLGYANAPLGDTALAALAARSRGADPRDLVPVGAAGLRSMVSRYVEAGFSKFVLRPLAPPLSWRDELQALSAAVLDLQT